ncbi:hypothetical protein DFH09DRAFT_1080443 [Mycena vulgaris]|nr:hypothetical protein DFH09DRAFT_1080443 [Mycena vulgaris]
MQLGIDRWRDRGGEASAAVDAHAFHAGLRLVKSRTIRGGEPGKWSRGLRMREARAKERGSWMGKGLMQANETAVDGGARTRKRRGKRGQREEKRRADGGGRGRAGWQAGGEKMVGGGSMGPHGISEEGRMRRGARAGKEAGSEGREEEM